MNNSQQASIFENRSLGLKHGFLTVFLCFWTDALTPNFYLVNVYLAWCMTHKIFGLRMGRIWLYFAKNFPSKTLYDAFLHARIANDAQRCLIKYSFPCRWPLRGSLINSVTLARRASRRESQCERCTLYLRSTFINWMDDVPSRTHWSLCFFILYHFKKKRVRWQFILCQLQGTQVFTTCGEFDEYFCYTYK